MPEKFEGRHVLSKLDAVGAVLDKSFERSSTSFGPSNTAVRGSLFGDHQIKLIYDIRQNFPRNYNLHDIKANLEVSGRKALDSELKRIKGKLKEEFDESITFKEISCESDVQIFSMTNANRQGRFVMTCIVEF